ncbi:MAG TPA: response regulator transcription factor [Candidatus Paceibacterota bacterium]|nr:response regulator transcription factor [Candidatus Paceibacterota bacterium]
MRILLIEDAADVADILKSQLEAKPFAVDVARDGERGSYLARTNGYDLILLDNLLPKKSGITVCGEIRAAGKNTPILVLSVKSETTAKIDLLNAGADDYLVKPFSLEELLARIRALLRRPARIETEVMKVGDFILDVKNCSLHRGKKEMHLTRKEFMLLEYLLKHRGSVLSRAMLMEHVWDMSVDPFSNTIESHILSLRKKLGGCGSRKLIQTISGRGYKIAAA